MVSSGRKRSRSTHVGITRTLLPTPGPCRSASTGIAEAARARIVVAERAAPRSIARMTRSSGEPTRRAPRSMRSSAQNPRISHTQVCARDRRAQPAGRSLRACRRGAPLAARAPRNTRLSPPFAPRPPKRCAAQVIPSLWRLSRRSSPGGVFSNVWRLTRTPRRARPRT